MTQTDKIHILHVLPTLGVGGMELALARVIKGLSSEQFRHSIVCLKGEPELSEYLTDDVNIYSMHAKPNEPALILRLLRTLRKIRPDLIHARNWSAWPEVTLARMLYNYSIPVVFSFHGFDAAGRVPFRRRLISKILSMVTDQIFTVAEVSRTIMANSLGINAARISVIPNGIETGKFYPVKTGKEHQGTMVIGSVGNLTPVKNHVLLVEACSELVRRGFNIKITIAGTGPEKEKIIALAESLGIRRCIELQGYVKDIPGFLNQLDIFVLSSLSEAHPNALLEAMACGLPKIRTGWWIVWKT